MIRPMQVLIGVAGVSILAGMMMSNPDYNRAVRPFVTEVAPGETGQTRLIAGKIDAWRTAASVTFGPADRETRRDSDGVFLIVDLTLSGTTRSAALDAYWIGASGRRYATTDRVTGLLRQIDELWLQPGLTSKTTAVFELPPDEVQGGAVLLTTRLDPMLDGTLRLSPDATPPTHKPHERIEG